MVTVGIDEVGRGCWAGPLVAAAVALRQPIPGLRDSKKLSKQQRESLVASIEQEALVIGIGWVWPETIDTGGLSQAVRAAMTQALVAIDISYDELIVDGNVNYFKDEPRARSLVRADDLIPAVSAASIVAKVARDRYMVEADSRYPGYGFANHVGYGTAAHVTALRELGVSLIHRQSYKPIRTLLEGNA